MPKQKPRNLHLNKAMAALAEWVLDTTRQAKGLVVGLSGIDSALTFHICAMARGIEGKPTDWLTGIHYGPEYAHEDYFRQYGDIQVVALPDNSHLDPDVYRWAALQSYALANDRWIVGTRNRTEHVLADYSNASMCAVIQPILPLWKSEVLALAEHEYLGIPKSLINASYLGDPECACHRPGLLGRLNACEIVLASRLGERDHETVMQETVHMEASDFLDRFVQDRSYKHKIPYVPPENILHEAIATKW